MKVADPLASRMFVLTARQTGAVKFSTMVRPPKEPDRVKLSKHRSSRGHEAHFFPYSTFHPGPPDVGGYSDFWFHGMVRVGFLRWRSRRRSFDRSLNQLMKRT